MKTRTARVCKAGMEHVNSTSTYKADMNYNYCNTMSKFYWSLFCTSTASLKSGETCLST